MIARWSVRDWRARYCDMGLMTVGSYKEKQAAYHARVTRAASVQDVIFRETDDTRDKYAETRLTEHMTKLTDNDDQA